MIYSLNSSLKNAILPFQLKNIKFQLTAYDKEYLKESRNISLWNVYDMFVHDIKVNK